RTRAGLLHCLPDDAFDLVCVAACPRPMGMHADTEPEARPARPQRRYPVEFDAIAGIQDAERALHASLLRPRNHQIEIVDELVAGQVTVRVDHRTIVPGVGGVSNDSNCARPSVSAASTM